MLETYTILAFLISGGDKDMFLLDSNTGILFTNQDLDIYTDRYIVAIRATDQLNNSAECQVNQPHYHNGTRFLTALQIPKFIRDVDST